MSDTISRAAAIDAKMKKYRKKPIVIEAYQTDVTLDIETLEGIMHASAGDYIIIGVNGEQYPCKPDIFEKTYEEVSDECLPSAQPKLATNLQQSCNQLATDCISRQAAIDSISADIMGGLNYESILKKLPSAERPTGEWIKDEFGITVCSECKRPRRDSRVDHINFCNSCGARMINTK